MSRSYDAFLDEALKELGMAVAFRPGADFTRMSPIGDRMCIDFVRQTTFVEADERGTRASPSPRRSADGALASDASPTSPASVEPKGRQPGARQESTE